MLYLRKRVLHFVCRTLPHPYESALLSSATFHSPSTSACHHKNVRAHPLSAPAPSRASLNSMPVTKTRRGASPAAPAQPSTPGPPPQCFNNCDNKVANVTITGYSGLNKRNGLGRRGPRGAGVRDEFGRPSGGLVALRHGHRARRGPVAVRSRGG
jgi:hypothetical protein